MKIGIPLIVWFFYLATFYPAVVDAETYDNGTIGHKETVQNIKKSNAHIYYANTDSTFLSAENRIIVHPDNSADFGKQIVAALLKGPKEGLVQTIPSGTRLRAFFLTTDGTAYVDLTEEISNRHPGGCYAELLTIFSIVNSLILNVPEINRVKLLVNGTDAATLAGHIDIRFPIQADMLLIR